MITIRKTLPIVLLVVSCTMTGPACSQEQSEVRHASQELLQLAAEFRDFRSPLFRPRTWRPTDIPDQVPDYAAVVRAQTTGLADFRQRLNALDYRDWPVHDQVDYLLLRAEMDDVYFEQHILREAETNPSY